MAWTILIASGAFEAVWAAALSASDGFRRWRPTVVFVVALTICMSGLAYAMTQIPTGTAYAVWVGVGATLTAIWAFATGQERATRARVLLLVLLVACVVGLRLVA